MPDPIPSCFRRGAATARPESTAAGPNMTTSIYETHLGLAALTWSRTALGLSLRVDIRLPSTSDASSVSSAAATECPDSSFHLCVRPWLFWKRRGSKSFQLKDPNHHHYRTIDFAWDLTRARFPACGGPEPSAGFFVAVAVDGEMFLVVGDSEEEAYKKTKARLPRARNPSRKGSASNTVLISRREHVVLPQTGGRAYTTKAKFGGKEREISIDLGGCGGGGREARMCLGLDGKRVLQVKRLKWKFRGNERVEVEGGSRIQVSWDVHNWLFQRETDESSTKSSSAAPSSELGHAVFVLRFEREGAEKGNDGYFGKCKNSDNSTATGTGCGNTKSGSGGGLWGLFRTGYFGNSEKSSSSAIGGGGGSVGKRGGKKRSLLKTSSSSSLSSASSGSSSSVMEWSSAEENELQGSNGFSLLVYVWKR